MLLGKQRESRHSSWRLRWLLRASLIRGVESRAGVRTGEAVGSRFTKEEHVAPGPEALLVLKASAPSLGHEGPVGSLSTSQVVQTPGGAPSSPPGALRVLSVHSTGGPRSCVLSEDLVCGADLWLARGQLPLGVLTVFPA